MYVNKDLPSHLGGHDNETHLDDGVLDYMIKKYSIKSYIDIGCGPGGMCELAASKGLKVLGIDGDYTLTHKEPTLIHDFTNGSASVEDIFDMAWSCEFLEHVEEKYMPHYMDSFQKAKYVVCTYVLNLF
jgi:2-polyprenyl-3-methyl-5-hydroxy-6-metoxy-1,4-benzoquinol methylase